MGQEELQDLHNKANSGAEDAKLALMILQTKELQDLPQSRLKELAARLSKSHPEVSKKIEVAFSHRTDNVDFRELMRGHPDSFKRFFEENPSRIDSFIDWSHDQITTDQDIDNLQLFTSNSSSEWALPLRQLAQFKQELKERDDNERAGISRELWPLAQDLSGRSQLSELIKQFCNLPEGARKLAPVALPFCKELKTVSERISMIDALHSIPSKEREEFFRSLPRLLEGVTQEQIAFLNTLTSIPPKECTICHTLAAPLLQSTTRGYSKGRIIAAIASLPPNQRADVVALVESIRQGVTNASKIEEIILALGSISPPEERAKVIELARPLLQGISDGNDAAAIIKAIKETPREQREELIARLDQRWQRSGRSFAHNKEDPLS
jgi:hypothetical protein